MRFMFRSLSLAGGLIWSCAAAAAGEQACQPQPGQGVKNADQSTLWLRTECPEPHTRAYVIELSEQSGGHRDRLIVEQDVEEAPWGHASLVDIDGDGMHEVEVRGACGAGPNCIGDLYRIDRGNRRLYHFFSGGYADLQVIDGHLVESGRASCCSWEFHGWRLDERPVLRDYDNMDLMAWVSASGDEEGNVAAVDCAFSRRNGDNWQTVPPPSPAWLQICQHYGQAYRLTPPEQDRQKAE